MLVGCFCLLVTTLKSTCVSWPVLSKSIAICFRYVDELELREKLATLGEKLEEEDINEMMKIAEVDKKGRIMYFGMINHAILL